MIAVLKSQHGSAVIRWNTKATTTRQCRLGSSAGLRRISGRRTRNGDSIPAGLSDSEWENATSGAVAVFGEGNSECDNYSPDGNACDETWSLNEYGRLYNWYAVDDARSLCPSGWHVPSDGEWTVIADFLGSSSVAGGQMKSTYGWHEGGNGTNSSGFSAYQAATVAVMDSLIALNRRIMWTSSTTAPL